MANSGGRASWSCGAHDGGLFSKLRGSSSGDASTTRDEEVQLGVVVRHRLGLHVGEASPL
jgi:hypothetical protein